MAWGLLGGDGSVQGWGPLTEVIWIDCRVGDEHEEPEQQDGDGDRHAFGGGLGRGFGLGDLVASEGVGLRRE
jgi:hypothetical protein